MAAQRFQQTLTLPEGRIIRNYLAQPDKKRRTNSGKNIGDDKYKVSLAIPKNADINPLVEALREVAKIELGAQPDEIKLFIAARIKDGDRMITDGKAGNTEELQQAHANSYILTPSTAFGPVQVGQFNASGAVEAMPVEDVNTGDFGCASVTADGFQEPHRGVRLFLDAFLVTRRGDPIRAGGRNLSEVFAGLTQPKKDVDISDLLG